MRSKRCAKPVATARNASSFDERHTRSEYSKTSSIELTSMRSVWVGSDNVSRIQAWRAARVGRVGTGSVTSCLWALSLMVICGVGSGDVDGDDNASDVRGSAA